MAKKRSPRPRSTVNAADIPVVGPRDPCPCGSGKKYRVCHGREAAVANRRLVARPFEGLPGECDWVAMKEMVPAATAPLSLNEEYRAIADGRAVTLATVIPGGIPGIVRPNGDVLVGLHASGGSGDLSRDVAEVLIRALQADPGTQITVTELPAPGPRLQDVLDTAAPFDVTMHADFGYWLADGAELPAAMKAALDRANDAVVPSLRLSGVESAYWARVGSKEYLRWVMPYDEEPLLDSFARLHAAGTDTLGPDTRFLGSFRAHGLLVPVWDLAPGTEAEEIEQPAAEYLARLQAAMAVSEPLTSQERHARAGLQNRQVTLR